MFCITRLHVTAILFACCYVTEWGKFGRVFCKQTSVAACRFQNECNKVEIALRVVQFWSEIKLVITNCSPASRSCDFVITRLVSDQIALHSVQLPLLIGANNDTNLGMHIPGIEIKETVENLQSVFTKPWANLTDENKLDTDKVNHLLKDIPPPRPSIGQEYLNSKKATGADDTPA